jgi:hypothetical protein
MVEGSYFQDCYYQNLKSLIDYVNVIVSVSLSFCVSVSVHVSANVCVQVSVQSVYVSVYGGQMLSVVMMSVIWVPQWIHQLHQAARSKNHI